MKRLTAIFLLFSACLALTSPALAQPPETTTTVAATTETTTHYMLAVFPFLDKSPAGEYIPPPPTPGVEVSPFTSYEWLSYAIPASLAYKIEKSKLLLVTSTDVLQDAAKSCNYDLQSELSDSQLIEMGKYAGASYLLCGNYIGKDKVLTINYRLLDVASGAVIAEGNLSGDEQKYSDYMTALAQKVVTAMGLTATDELALSPTANLNALKWYAKGVAAPATGQKISFFTQAIGQDADFSLAYAKLAEAMYNEKDYESAIKNYLTAIEKEPLPSSYLGLGLVYLIYGQRKLDALVIADKNLLKVLDDLGKALSTMTVSVDDKAFNTHLEKVFSELSKVEYKEGVSIDPELVSAISALSAAANNIKLNYGDEFIKLANTIADAEKAVENAKKGTQEKAPVPEEFAKAKEAFQNALALDPNYIPAEIRLGVVIEENKDYSGAIDHFLKILAKNDRIPEIYSHLGNDYWIAGATSKDWKTFFQKAVDAYGKALEFRPNWALVHYNIASLYLKLSQFDQSIAHFQRYLELEPNTDKYNDIIKTIENMKSGKMQTNQ
jgi:tetratricopeptide (TPR) repeat protein